MFEFPHHISDLWVCRFHQHPSVGGDVVDQLVKRGPLDLLALQVCHRVKEVEKHAALLEFLGEKFLLLCRGGIWNYTNERKYTDSLLMYTRQHNLTLHGNRIWMRKRDDDS